MTDTSGRLLDDAISKISVSDPLVKLLHEVKLGRMKATDAGLRAITESWVDTYRQVLEGVPPIDPASMRRLDPSPRLDVLIAAGVLSRDHPAVLAIRGVFDGKLAGSRREKG